MFKERKEHLSSYVHVFHKTSHWDVSLCRRAVDVKEISARQELVASLKCSKKREARAEQLFC